jgi:hypothetical protein
MDEQRVVNVGRQLHTLRTELGLSLRQLSEKVAVSLGSPRHDRLCWVSQNRWRGSLTAATKPTESMMPWFARHDGAVLLTRCASHLLE